MELLLKAITDLVRHQCESMTTVERIEEKLDALTGSNDAFERIENKLDAIAVRLDALNKARASKASNVPVITERVERYDRQLPSEESMLESIKSELLEVTDELARTRARKS